jgi:hypothetical protein
MRETNERASPSETWVYLSSSASSVLDSRCHCIILFYRVALVHAFAGIGAANCKVRWRQGYGGVYEAGPFLFPGEGQTSRKPTGWERGQAAWH